MSDEVVGGSLNIDGHLIVRATRVGADTSMAHLVRLVEQAQAKKADVQKLVDRVSSIFVPIVIMISLATLLIRLSFGSSAALAFSTAVAVLIIACPCALGLATPMAILVGTGRAAQLGILIRGPEVLEAANKIDTVVLDKTGTLTTGEMSMVGSAIIDESSLEELLSLAASVEFGSLHPIAKSIVKAADHAGVSLKAAKDFASVAGEGVTAMIENSQVYIGKFEYVQQGIPTLATELAEKVEALLSEKPQLLIASRVYVGWDGGVKGILFIGDEIRSEARSAVAAMVSMGLDVVLLTGDSDLPAQTVAKQVGIQRVYSDVSPVDKQAVIAKLQNAGKNVAMVGDGINDSAALAQANLGISMGSGTQVAMESSDLTVFSGGVFGALDAIRLSRKTLGTIRSNLFWAFAYNTVAIPIAVFGLVNPVIAGAAMAFSSVFVVGNSVRLFSFRPKMTLVS